MILSPSSEAGAQFRNLTGLNRVWGYRDHKNRNWFFNSLSADRAVRWIEEFCRHTKGEWAGQKFKLALWQRKIVRQIFGWMNARGFRRFQTVWIEVPRKNGKSTFASALAAYMLIADGEPGAEIYSVAGNEAQARLVYNDTRAMIEIDSRLSLVCKTAKIGLVVERTRSKMLALGKNNQHGLNPHCVIGDEVHEWKGEEQYEAVTTAVGARRQPLLIFITTAGHGRESLCWRLHNIALQVREGVLDMPDMYVRIFAASKDDDWLDERVWYRANPGMRYGAPKIETMRAKADKAKASPAEENSFKRLHLNMWTDSLTAWITSDNWNVAAVKVDLSKLIGCDFYGGLDLARVQDLSCFMKLFTPSNKAIPGKWILVPRFWCPEDNLAAREKESGVSYRGWASSKLLETTPGEVTDFAWIEAGIRRDAERFNMLSIGCDMTLAGEIVNNLSNDNYPVELVRQGFLTLGPATSEFERRILGGEMVHSGHEIMGWNVANTSVVMDPAGNIKPDRKRSADKIDGVAAGVNAVAVAMGAMSQRKNDLETRMLEVG